jgi:S1 RNA binding domain protein
MAEDKEKSTAVIAVGDEVEGSIEHITAYGAFVRLGTGQKAMIHISELSHEYVQKVEDILEVEQKVKAKVIKIDEKGRIDLSLKALQAKASFSPPPSSSSKGAKAKSSPDDFEKQLSSFLKRSEEKIAEIAAKNKGKSGGRRRGSGTKG